MLGFYKQTGKVNVDVVCMLGVGVGTGRDGIMGR